MIIKFFYFNNVAYQKNLLEGGTTGEGGKLKLGKIQVKYLYKFDPLLNIIS